MSFSPMSFAKSVRAPARFGAFSRLILAVVSIVLLVALVGSALGVWSLLRVSVETEKMVDGAMVAERLTSDLRRYLEVNVARARALALSSEPQVEEAITPEIEKTSASVATLLETLGTSMTASNDLADFNALVLANTTFVQARKALMQARDGGLTSNIEMVYRTRFSPTASALLSEVNQLGEARRLDISRASEQVHTLSQNARLGLILFGLGAVLLGGMLSFWLVRGITRPIQQAVDTANRVAALDLTMQIEGHERDEGGQLLSALARMQHSLGELVSQVQEASQNVAEGSTQIAAGNLDLSRRTEMAASFLQQTAAAVEEISTAMNQSLELAGQGEMLVQSASVQAQAGNAAMTEVMQTMQEISASSRQIEDITSVIDGLAFQTNILALNAAVEAARAGVAGRGFAAVAAEVRTLANRSASAAHDIKALIAASVSKVEQGTRKVNHARDSMSSMVGSVRQVASSIGEIRGNTGEQSVGMASISAAVNQLDQMTQQNAAAVEESASAAQSLQAQARDLRDSATRFLLPVRDYPSLLQTPRQKLRQALALGV
ncbi:methyl-accepting chemotaxis protein [Rhodoferax sp. PAMC 29310]|uniref:methyl-accepting chemotaxis protein n=1 Tax=Rhodoferax sp. PAMC 29310 TaxID=2822760 RepID=UPI001B3304B5|nr:methyl-accepting chemotaxis protein [Rhodoferax sp. PAMC 29310]